MLALLSQVLGLLFPPPPRHALAYASVLTVDARRGGEAETNPHISAPSPCSTRPILPPHQLGTAAARRPKLLTEAGWPARLGAGHRRRRRQAAAPARLLSETCPALCRLGGGAARQLLQLGCHVHDFYHQWLLTVLGLPGGTIPTFPPRPSPPFSHHISAQPLPAAPKLLTAAGRRPAAAVAITVARWAYVRRFDPAAAPAAAAGFGW